MSEDPHNEPRASASAPPPPEVSPEASPDDPSTWSEADHLRHFLKGRDAKCPECQYNLRDLESASCPECGNALKLVLRCEEMAQIIWIILVILICAPIGLGILIGSYIIEAIRFSPSLTREDFILGVVVLYYIAGIPLAIWLIIKRKTFMAISAESRGVLIFLVFTISTLALFVTLHAMP